jgi:hypothetical protein
MTEPNEPAEYDPPIVTRAVTDHLKGSDPLTWQLKGPHPYLPDMKVMAMFLHNGILEIYSTDGKTGIRERIPMNRVRITQEHIVSEILLDEIDASEVKHLGLDDVDDDDEDDEPETASPIPSTNGSTAPP